MLYRILPITALLALAVGCAAPGQSGGDATARPLNTPTVAEFSDFLKKQGHSTKLQAGNSGAPTLVVNEDGDNFVVQFFDCSVSGGLAARRCTGAEFSVTYRVDKKPTLSEINELNSKYRMAKTYVNADGNPGVSMALNIGGTFSSGNLRDTLEWWNAVMRKFEKDIGWA